MIPTSSSNEVKWFYDEEYLKYGIKKWITWNPKTCPHIVVFGITGSGKTYASKRMLSAVALKFLDAQYYVADFKGDSDFSFLNSSKRFYRFMDCERGLDEFYRHFLRRQSGEDLSRNLVLLFFDEWSSYLLTADKRQAEESKKKMSALLQLSRSFNMHVFISQQRIDAVNFNSSRDCLNVKIAFQNLSAESRDMAFREFKEFIKPDRKQGTGVMTTNDSNFVRIVAPTIHDMEKVHFYIKDAVNR